MGYTPFWATLLLIILSVLIISLFLYQSQATSHFTNRRLFKRDPNLVELIILVCSHLFNNISKNSDNFLRTIWGFTSVILIACFCGDILSLLVNQDLNWPKEFGWDDKTAGFQVLMAKMTEDNQYKSTVEAYSSFLVNTAPKSPKGMVCLDQWGALRHAANSALICLQVCKYIE